MFDFRQREPRIKIKNRGRACPDLGRLFFIAGFGSHTHTKLSLPHRTNVTRGQRV